MPWDSLTDIQQRIDRCIDGFSQCILDLNQSGNIWRSTNFRCQATRPVRLTEYWSYMYLLELMEHHSYLLQLLATDPPNQHRVERSLITLEMVIRDVSLHLVGNLIDRQSAYTIRYHGYKPFLPWRFWIRSTSYAPPPHTFQDDDSVLDLENSIIGPIFRPLCIREELINKCIEVMHSVTMKERNASHLRAELLSLAKQLAEAQHDFERILWEHSELRRRTFVSNYVPTPFTLEKTPKDTPGKGKAKDSAIKVLKDGLQWVPLDGSVPPSDRATSWVRWWYSAMQPQAAEDVTDLLKIRHLLYHLDGRITNVPDSFVNMEYSLTSDVQKVLLNQLQKYHNRMQDLKNFHDSLVYPYSESDSELEEGDLPDGVVGKLLDPGASRRNSRWGHLQCYQLLRHAQMGGYLSRNTLPDLDHIANHFLHHLNKHGLIHTGSSIDNGVIFRAAMQFTVLTKSRNRERAAQQLHAYRNQDLEEIDNLLAQEGPSEGTSDPLPEPPVRQNQPAQGRGHSHASNFQSGAGRAACKGHATVDPHAVAVQDEYEDVPSEGRTIQTLFEEAVCERFARRAAERITQSLGVKATVECRSPSQTPPPQYQSNVSSRDTTPVRPLQTTSAAAVSVEDEPSIPAKQKKKSKSTQKQKKLSQQKPKGNAVTDSLQAKESEAVSPDNKVDSQKTKTPKSDIRKSDSAKQLKGQKSKSKTQNVGIKSDQDAVIETNLKESATGSHMNELTKSTNDSKEFEDVEVIDADNQPKVSKRKQKKMNRINELNQKKEIVNNKKKESYKMAEVNTPKKKEDTKGGDKIRPTKEGAKEGDKIRPTKEGAKEGDKMKPTKEGAKEGDKMKPTKEGAKEGDKMKLTKDGAKEGDKMKPMKDGAKEGDKMKPTKAGAKEGDKMKPTKAGAKEGDKMKPTKEGAKEGDKIRPTKEGAKEGDKIRPKKYGAKEGDEFRPKKDGAKEGPTKEGAKEGDEIRPTKEGAKEGDKIRPTKEGSKEGDKNRPTKEGAKEGDDNNNNLNKDQNHPNGKRMHAGNQGLKMEKHLIARGPSLRTPQEVASQGKMTPSCAGPEHSRAKRSTFLAGSRGEKKLTVAEGKEDASNEGKETDKKARKTGKQMEKVDEKDCSEKCTCSNLDRNTVFWETSEPGQWQPMDIWPRILSVLEETDSDLFPCFDALTPDEIDNIFDTAVLTEEEFRGAFRTGRVSDEVSAMFDTELVQAVVLTALLDDEFRTSPTHSCNRRMSNEDTIKLKGVVGPMLIRLVTLGHIDTRSKQFTAMVTTQKSDFLFMIKSMAETFATMAKRHRSSEDGAFATQCFDVFRTLFENAVFRQLGFFETILDLLSNGGLKKDRARIFRQFQEHRERCRSGGNLQFPSKSHQGTYTLILHDVYSTATSHFREVKKTQAFARVPREAAAFLARRLTTVTMMFTLSTAVDTPPNPASESLEEEGVDLFIKCRLHEEYHVLKT